jgi:Holliday junction resolvase RusA-like endonuclease
VIRFYCAGIPKSMSVGKTVRWQTKDKAQAGSFQKRAHTEWATLLGHVGRQHAPVRPLKGALSFTALFYVPRPASLSKREWAPLKRPDIDNLIHKLTDQWNGVLWEDDSQLIDLVARKRFALDGRPGVEIIVEPVSCVST